MKVRSASRFRSKAKPASCRLLPSEEIVRRSRLISLNADRDRCDAPCDCGIARIADLLSLPWRFGAENENQFAPSAHVLLPEFTKKTERSYSLCHFTSGILFRGIRFRITRSRISNRIGKHSASFGQGKVSAESARLLALSGSAMPPWPLSTLVAY
jgi:hypothetical protein